MGSIACHHARQFLDDLELMAREQVSGLDKATRLASVFLNHAHLSNCHRPINGFAHVVNREQGDLRSSKRFHFHASRTDSLNGRGALNAAGLVICFKVDGYFCQNQWMA